jgi:hypothetical protein
LFVKKDITFLLLEQRHMMVLNVLKYS